MAKKKTATRKPTAKTPTPAPAKTPATKQSIRPKGLFQPGGGDDHTAAEKSLANAVAAAGGTDKLLVIMRHVDAAGGTKAAVEALEVYERMRKVLQPCGEATSSHPLFETMEKSSDGDESAAKD